MQLIRAILTVGLFIALECQLFDRSEVKDGESFNLTCDVSRIGNVPKAVAEIYFLTIERTVVSSTEVTIIATYLLHPSEVLEETIPYGRAWVIESSGGKVPNNLDNRASIKIILYVPDVNCGDAGSYRCTAGFRPTVGVSVAGRSQNMTVKARIEEHVLTLDHHYGNAPNVSTNTVGQEVKLTCTLEGPVGLQLIWLTGPNGGTNFVPYPTDGVQMVTPRPTSDPCKRGKYVSTLTFKVPAVDTKYMCVVKDGDVEASRKNFKIVLKTSNKETPLGIMDSHWFVRNMFVMVAGHLMWS